jgi:hypothetical protein
MFALSFLMLFTIAFISTFNLKRMAVERKVKNISSSIMLISSTVVSYSVFIFFSGENSFIEEANILFSSYQIYLCIFVEMLGLWIARTNYEKNGDNITAINVTMFLSLLLVPIVSYFLTSPMGFSETINVNYESQYELWIFIGLMTVLLSGFFVGKLNGHINNWVFLLLTPVVLSFTMFITTKLMQLHDAYFVYGTIALINSIIFGSIALIKKEQKSLHKGQTNHFLLLSLSSILFVPLNAIVVKLIAVEFITLLKRIAQILTGSIVDHLHGNKNNMNTKDKIIVSLIFSMALGLYYFRG